MLTDAEHVVARPRPAVGKGLLRLAREHHLDDSILDLGEHRVRVLPLANEMLQERTHGPCEPRAFVVDAVIVGLVRGVVALRTFHHRRVRQVHLHVLALPHVVRVQLGSEERQAVLEEEDAQLQHSAIGVKTRPSENSRLQAAVLTGSTSRRTT